MQAGLTHSPLGSHGCSAGDGGETAPAGTLAEGKAFSSHFGRQSLPLCDRYPFEILCLASSRLFTPRRGARAAEAPCALAAWPAAPAQFAQGPGTDPADTAAVQLRWGNEPC